MVVVGVLAVMLAVLGYYASTRVGPASVVWESVPVSGAEAVRLERGAGSQRWWLAQTGATASAQVNGPEVVVEVRLLMADSTTSARNRFVVAVTLDGLPHDWEALTATPDTTATLEAWRVGDRDRILVRLPTGVHDVGVRLVEGHGKQILVRVRQREQR
jgi:hypothetical protein